MPAGSGLMSCTTAISQQDAEDERKNPAAETSRSEKMDTGHNDSGIKCLKTRKKYYKEHMSREERWDSTLIQHALLSRLTASIFDHLKLQEMLIKQPGDEPIHGLKDIAELLHQLHVLMFPALKEEFTVQHIVQALKLNTTSFESFSLKERTFDTRLKGPSVHTIKTGENMCILYESCKSGDVLIIVFQNNGKFIVLEAEPMSTQELVSAAEKAVQKFSFQSVKSTVSYHQFLETEFQVTLASFNPTDKENLLKLRESLFLLGYCPSWAEIGKMISRENAFEKIGEGEAVRLLAEIEFEEIMEKLFPKHFDRPLSEVEEVIDKLFPKHVHKSDMTPHDNTDGQHTPNNDQCTNNSLPCDNGDHVSEDNYQGYPPSNAIRRLSTEQALNTANSINLLDECILPTPVNDNFDQQFLGVTNSTRHHDSEQTSTQQTQIEEQLSLMVQPFGRKNSRTPDYVNEENITIIPSPTANSERLAVADNSELSEKADSLSQTDSFVDHEQAIRLTYDKHKKWAKTGETLDVIKLLVTALPCKANHGQVHMENLNGRSIQPISDKADASERGIQPMSEQPETVELSCKIPVHSETSSNTIEHTTPNNGMIANFQQVLKDYCETPLPRGKAQFEDCVPDTVDTPSHYCLTSHCNHSGEALSTQVDVCAHNSVTTKQPSVVKPPCKPETFENAIDEHTNTTAEVPPDSEEVKYGEGDEEANKGLQVLSTSVDEQSQLELLKCSTSTTKLHVPEAIELCKQTTFERVVTETHVDQARSQFCGFGTHADVNKRKSEHANVPVLIPEEEPVEEHSPTTPNSKVVANFQQGPNVQNEDQESFAISYEAQSEECVPDTVGTLSHYHQTSHCNCVTTLSTNADTSAQNVEVTGQPPPCESKDIIANTTTELPLDSEEVITEKYKGDAEADKGASTSVSKQSQLELQKCITPTTELPAMVELHVCQQEALTETNVSIHVDQAPHQHCSFGTCANVNKYKPEHVQSTAELSANVQVLIPKEVPVAKHSPATPNSKVADFQQGPNVEKEGSFAISYGKTQSEECVPDTVGTLSHYHQTSHCNYVTTLSANADTSAQNVEVPDQPPVERPCESEDIANTTTELLLDSEEVITEKYKERDEEADKGLQTASKSVSKQSQLELQKCITPTTELPAMVELHVCQQEALTETNVSIHVDQAPHQHCSFGTCANVNKYKPEHVQSTAELSANVQVLIPKEVPVAKHSPTTPNSKVADFQQGPNVEKEGSFAISYGKAQSEECVPDTVGTLSHYHQTSHCNYVTTLSANADTSAQNVEVPDQPPVERPCESEDIIANTTTELLLDSEEVITEKYKEGDEEADKGLQTASKSVSKQSQLELQKCITPTTELPAMVELHVCQQEALTETNVSIHVDQAPHQHCSFGTCANVNKYKPEHVQSTTELPANVQVLIPEKVPIVEHSSTTPNSKLVDHFQQGLDVEKESCEMLYEKMQSKDCVPDTNHRKTLSTQVDVNAHNSVTTKQPSVVKPPCKPETFENAIDEHTDTTAEVPLDSEEVIEKYIEEYEEADKRLQVVSTSVSEQSQLEVLNCSAPTTEIPAATELCKQTTVEGVVTESNVSICDDQVPYHDQFCSFETCADVNEHKSEHVQSTAAELPANLPVPISDKLPIVEHKYTSPQKAEEEEGGELYGHKIPAVKTDGSNDTQYELNKKVKGVSHACTLAIGAGANDNHTDSEPLPENIAVEDSAIVKLSHQTSTGNMSPRTGDSVLPYTATACHCDQPSHPNYGITNEHCFVQRVAVKLSSQAPLLDDASDDSQTITTTESLSSSTDSDKESIPSDEVDHNIGNSPVIVCMSFKARCPEDPLSHVSNNTAFGHCSDHRKTTAAAAIEKREHIHQQSISDTKQFQQAMRVKPPSHMQAKELDLIPDELNSGSLDEQNKTDDTLKPVYESVGNISITPEPRCNQFPLLGCTMQQSSPNVINKHEVPTEAAVLQPNKYPCTVLLFQGGEQYHTSSESDSKARNNGHHMTKKKARMKLKTVNPHHKQIYKAESYFGMPYASICSDEDFEICPKCKISPISKRKKPVITLCRGREKKKVSVWKISTNQMPHPISKPVQETCTDQSKPQVVHGWYSQKGLCLLCKMQIQNTVSDFAGVKSYEKLKTLSSPSERLAEYMAHSQSNQLQEKPSSTISTLSLKFPITGDHGASPKSIGVSPVKSKGSPGSMNFLANQAHPSRPKTACPEKSSHHVTADGGAGAPEGFVSGHQIGSASENVLFNQTHSPRTIVNVETSTKESTLTGQRKVSTAPREAHADVENVDLVTNYPLTDNETMPNECSRRSDYSFSQRSSTRTPPWVSAVAQLLHVPDYQKMIYTLSSVIPTPEEQVPHLFIRGLAYFKLGKLKQALKDLCESERLAQELNRRGDVALNNSYIGDLNYSSRSYPEAATCYQKAIQYYEPKSVAKMFRMIPPSLSVIHAKCGSCYRNLSKSVEAIQEYKRAVETAVKDKDKLTSLTSLGNLYQSYGQNNEALSEYKEALVIAERLSDHMSIGWTHGNIGNAYLGLYRKDEALFHLQKALDLTVRYEPTPAAIGRAYNNIGTAYQSLGNLDKAQEYYDLALAQAIYGNDSAGQARVYGNIGNVLIIQKEHEKAIPHYTEVLRLSKDESTITTAQHNRGCAYYEWAESKMVSLEKSTSATNLKFRIHGEDRNVSQEHSPRIVIDSIAKLYRQGKNDLQDVIETHEKKLNHIKGSTKGLSFSVSLSETNSRTFHRLQDCMVNLGEWRDTLLIAEQSRARTLGEMMLARKKDQLESPLISPLNLEHIFSIVSSQSSPVLYLSHTGASLLGWVFVPNEARENTFLEMFEVPLSEDQFEGKSFDYHIRYSLTDTLVEQSYEMYCSVMYDQEYTEPVVKLFELVGRPLLTILNKAKEERKLKKITLITDTYTSLLPIACLYDPDSKTFLGDQFYFESTLSLLTMGIMNQMPEPIVELPADAQNMCIIGNPTIPKFYLNNEVWSLGKLPYAKQEAQWVGHILETPPILEEQATKSAILMRFMRAKVIHIATHGSSASGFLAFATLTSTRQGDVVDSSGVLLYPEEVEKLSISPALVVLSSCDSSRGTVKADGIQGMARAFILAGAQAVMTALWRVPDESAAVFMRFFYRFLVEGFESSLALQKSVLSLRCFSKYSQYIHWSGYQLTGRSIRLDVKPSSRTQILKATLGSSTVFPQLMLVKKLQSVLVEDPRIPTDVQILHGSPGVKPSEIAIDFIHSSHETFAAGVYWINCRTPDLINASVAYIEKLTGKALNKMRLNESQQALIILDNPTELPDSAELAQLFKHSNVHIIVLAKSADNVDPLVKEIDRALIRGCNIHEVKTLSTIASTQRTVYEVFKKHNLSASNEDQAVFERLAEFTSGSPVIVDIAVQVLVKFVEEHSDNPSEGVREFAQMIELSKSRKLSPMSSLDLNQTMFQVRTISHELTSLLPKIASIPPNHNDVWESDSEYDSWDSIAALLSCCIGSPGEMLLLRSLAIFGCSPIPLPLVISMSTFIAESSGHSHLSGIMHEKLMEAKVIKRYPQPVVLHSSFTTDNTSTEPQFVYVPQHLASHLWFCDEQDQMMAIAIAYKALEKLVTYAEKNLSLLHFYLGLIPLLEEKTGNLGEEAGKKWYQEVYGLYLNLYHQLYISQHTN